MRPLTAAFAGLLIGGLFSTAPLTTSAVAQTSVYQTSPGYYGGDSYRGDRRRDRRARSNGPQQIACTTFGCHPIPRNCHVILQKYWDGTTTGYDAISCP